MYVTFRQVPRRPEWDVHMQTQDFDPHDYSDGDEFQDAVEEWANQSDMADGFSYYDDDAPVTLNPDDWAEMVELADTLAASYFDTGALKAIADYESWTPRELIDNIDSAEERFQGEYSSGALFAQSDYGETCYTELRRLPDAITESIDWDMVWDNYMSSDYTEIYHNGSTYIFRDH